MTARQAASALGVSLPTLYSYVSRGMVRSEEVSGDSRIRRYWREDVNRLVERKDFRKNPANAAARGLHWGSPVLESALTLIDQGRLFYRGMDAIELARHATFEEVAALLWTGDSMEAEKLFSKEAFKGSSKLPAFFKQAAITARSYVASRCCRSQTQPIRLRTICDQQPWQDVAHASFP